MSDGKRFTLSSEEIVAASSPGDRLRLQSFAANRDSGGMEYELNFVSSIEDPLFKIAYEKLWQQFGALNEIESLDILRRRFQRCGPMGNGPVPETGHGGDYWMHYEMLVVQKIINGSAEFVAVRDHTVIISKKSHEVTVHLSHALIHEDYRGGALSAWLRTVPLLTAQRFLRELKLSPQMPIILVAELEYGDSADHATMLRLRSYEKAGFSKVDPEYVHYYQPDFRDAALIDRAPPARPVPFQLIIRRVGEEQETHISGRQLRSLIHALYTHFNCEFRDCDMKTLWFEVEKNYPADSDLVPLIPPTTGRNL